MVKLDDVLGKLNQELIDNDHDTPCYDSDSDSDSFDLSNAIVQKRIGSTGIASTTQSQNGMPHSQDSNFFSSSSTNAITNTSSPDRNRSKSLATSFHDSAEKTSQKTFTASRLDTPPRPDLS